MFFSGMDLILAGIEEITDLAGDNGGSLGWHCEPVAIT
jgi:hypothetical protein